MGSIDLKEIQSGDLVEYQRPSGNHLAHGTFLGWHSADNGQTRLIVRNLELGIEILVDPKRGACITSQGEEQHE